MLKHSPILAKDVQVGDHLTHPQSLHTSLVESVTVWPSNEVAIVFRPDPFQTFTAYHTTDDLVWVADPFGEPHPLETNQYVRVNRRDLLDVLALIEDEVELDGYDLLGDAVRRLEEAANHV